MAAVERSDRAAVTRSAVTYARLALAALIAVVYLHNALPYLTMLPRVNVDEPWLMERAYQVMQTGQPRQPMYGLDRPYLLQAGYPYLLAGWMEAFGVGLRQARLLGVVLGLGILVMVAVIGWRLLGTAAAGCAALFLAADSNFLGGVRNARTDIPAVFFASAALAAYAVGRDRQRAIWWWLSGICAGLGMLCHGNTFWIGAVLGLWLLIDRGRRVFATRDAYCVFGGLALTVAPYVAIVLSHWAEVQRQVNVFVPERVPLFNPTGMLHQMTLEVARYRTWYFGLVTNTVPNPLLLAFQVATVAGVAWLAWRVIAARGHDSADGASLVLALVGGVVLILAALINNKVPVYMPHLLIGFSLAAGFAVGETARTLASWSLAWAASAGRRTHAQRFAMLVALFIVGYGTAAIAYYEKWYSSARKSELVPYERTAATLRTLVPQGAKIVYGSPHFWTPFHADAETRFISYAMGVSSIRDDRPVYLLVDEAQWLPDMTAPASGATRRAWLDFIERDCALDAMALGTAYGTIGLYRCDRARRPDPRTPRIVGDGSVYRLGGLVSNLGPDDLLRWTRYDDPRRRPTDTPTVSISPEGLRIAGTGWPGVVTDYQATPGDAYLIRVAVAGAHDGDLLYLGTWKQPQLVSLGRASSAGMPTPLAHLSWFPGDRAFIATAPRVQVLIYSEAPQTDFTVSSLQVFRLTSVLPESAER